MIPLCVGKWVHPATGSAPLGMEPTVRNNTGGTKQLKRPRRSLVEEQHRDDRIPKEVKAWGSSVGCVRELVVVVVVVVVAGMQLYGWS